MAGTDPALRTALNAHLEYQNAKGFRRTLTTKLALFVVGIGILTLGLHFLPTAALLTTVLLASGMVVVASTNERKARRRLAEQLNGPHGQ
jgi:hypothetical protein